MLRNTKRLIEKLRVADPSIRRRAAEELREGDDRAIYPLIKALSDENTGVQDAAMRSLIAIGGETVAYMALPLLRENSYLRNTGLIILRQLGEYSVPLLYPLLKDKDHDVRKFAIDLLGEIGAGVDEARIVPLLDDENANVRAAAAKSLGDLGYRESIPQLIKALGDQEWVCFYALQSLGELKATEAVSAITDLLANPSEAVRFSAIETIGRLGSAEGLHPLHSYLPRASEDERLVAVKSIIQIGISPEMQELAGPIMQMYREGDWEDRAVALKGFIALRHREAIPVLVEAAGELDPSNPDAEERYLLLKEAILAIGTEDDLLGLLDYPGLRYRGKSFIIDLLGELKSKKAVAKLTAFIKDVSRELRKATVEALGEIGEPSSVDDLIAASQSDEDAHVRRSAIEAIGNLHAREAYPVLKTLLEVEKYRDILERVVDAMIKIDRAAFLAGIDTYSGTIRQITARVVTDTATLLTLSRDADTKVRIAAIGSMGRIGSEEAIESISAFLNDADPEIRKAAVIAFGDSRYCTSNLWGSLCDADPWVRFYAIKSVASACDRETAIERIRETLNDPYIPVVMSAIDTLRDLGGQEAYEALSARAEHENPDVREKIREALDAL